MQPDRPYHLEILQAEEEVIPDVAVPIFGGAAGVAHVGMSRHRLDQALSELIMRLLLTTLLVSLLGVSASATLTWVLTRPVLALAQATRRVAHGDLSCRLAPWADDEIGRLQASFNTMVENLARFRQEMEASNAISRVVSGPLELMDVLERSLHQMMGIAGASAGWICTLGADSSCQVCVTTWEENNQPNLGLEFCRQCPACRRARKNGRILVIKSLPTTCPLRATCTAGGHPVTSHVALPLMVKDQAVGMLNLVGEREGCCDETDLMLLEALGRQLAVAVENARLWAEVRRKESMRRELLHRVITAQEEERQRIARELHDESGQALTSLLVGFRLLEKAGSLEQAQALSANMREVVAQTLDNIHRLALELRPTVLDDLGLVPALARYVLSCQARFGLQADFVAAGLDGQRLPGEVETTLYRIAQEALTNVACHSRANHASVLLERRKDSVVLMVEDDGEGFDVAQAVASAQEQNRLGLYGMGERASLVGGHLAVESEPGIGTTISVTIPLEGAEPT
ncbi:MAG: GAF domain-containing protein [Anaerolineae bacterium]